ncbi:1-aminocyclopropane-1-carboxylate deaminase/D-cysteine desulfhydrase [Methylocucumis oryzae]|uniref:1-aminocyclopropane-1-carboxylate deaminase n=1 Tax=Methylocucumis oryzae TaxID=1632867 RepID=A0A0F3IM61_9GAMM|nr:pyridoxal-phosphate dependent enzyme [Methylocucumis oryzae]KJV07757.1 1-aminocyclopropane-1-carboxylate deaminase [Methylocucumis oryzae]
MTIETEFVNKQALINHYTKLIPRHVLAHYPTPLLRANCLATAGGAVELWFKRDDLISFGFGGNKIRGLEVMLADAIRQHANCFVTGAGVQSNHVRATAAVAAQQGLPCTAVYWGKPPTAVDGNYRLSRLFNANFHFTHDDDRASVDSHISLVAENLRQQGYRPYAIPRGGACAMGVLGHVLAVFELYQQCLCQGVGPDAIVLAVGSGGTYAGWLLGTKLLKLSWTVLGFTVSREADAVSQQVADLASQAATLLQLDWRFQASDAPVYGGFIGQGYGIPSSEAADAIQRVAQAEGVLLDPVYTGKAMAGLLHGLDKQQWRYKTLVFIHTGGEPAFFCGQWRMVTST